MAKQVEELPAYLMNSVRYGNIAPFSAGTNMSPLQALLSALEFAENDNMQDALIVGYDAAGDLIVRSSQMDRKDALWLAEQLRQYALGLEP